MVVQVSSSVSVSEISALQMQMVRTGTGAHPLDPLSTAEIAAATAAVRAAIDPPQMREGVRFIEVCLDEPDEHTIALADEYISISSSSSYAFQRRSMIPEKLGQRQAMVTVYNNISNETSVWLVQLNGHEKGTIISSETIENVQPSMDAQEYADCESTIKAYPSFREAMKRRGIDNMDLLIADPWCVGYYDEGDSPSRRLARPLIFCKTQSNCPIENGYARPVEGIHVLVDLKKMQVIEFEDSELIPLPPADPLRNFTAAEIHGGMRKDVKTFQISQPDGPSFQVNGYHIQWQKWSFRLGFTPKEGVVLHCVKYVDGFKGQRSVAHRLSFVEMVVPYGDPNPPHYRKNAFDAGEDGLGKNAHSLKKGCDCLGYIKYFDAHFTNFFGGVGTIENCVCLHEEDYGILWKHKDWRTGLQEVRRCRRLVVSFICTVANYDYGFFWYFYQDGKIEAEVKLTGILSLGALKPGEKRKYGTVIAPQLYAPVHQHFFVARMHMSVDSRPGEAVNQVVEVNLETEDAGPHNPHNNAFFAKEEILRTELDAQRDVCPSSARHWIVRNTKVLNRTGLPTGYKLVPGSNCSPLARPEAKFLRRAAFLKHNLWVTPYHKQERFPGGEFPNQNPRIGEGLTSWVKQNRNIQEADIVLWYVFGITHVPRLEDWPVLPVERIGFMLTPDGFFDCSPALDVPPGNVDEGCKKNRKEIISKL